MKTNKRGTKNQYQKKTSVFVYPTETAYGLGCDARDRVAVKKIFAIKGRSLGKTLPIIAADAHMVARYVSTREWRHKEIQRAVKLFWPGALTLVLCASTYARRVLAPGIIARDGTIAIRVSDHEIARAISKSIGAPIVSTSANRAGEKNMYSVASVKRVFAKHAITPDVMIDAGALHRRASSTIARFERGAWHIIRAGALAPLLQTRD